LMSNGDSADDLIFTNLVTLADEDAAAPLASMIADLIRQNVERDETKALTITSLEFTATIVATDLDSSVTLQFRGAEGLLVRAGSTGTGPDVTSVTIRADSNSILDLARLSLFGPTGIPILWNKIGASVLRRVIRREIRIEPAGRHLSELTRLLTVMSVA